MFLQARQVYSAVVRLALVYRTVVWHTLTKGPKGKVQRLAAKLEKIQNKCLRRVAGVYRATLIRSLETETFTPPIDLYLDSWLAVFQKQLKDSEVGQIIENSCVWIRARIKNRKRYRIIRKITIKEQRDS